MALPKVSKFISKQSKASELGQLHHPRAKQEKGKSKRIESETEGGKKKKRRKRKEKAQRSQKQTAIRATAWEMSLPQHSTGTRD